MSSTDPIPHTTPVLVFDTDDGEKSMTRTGNNGQMSVFMHCMQGAAIFTLAPGDDRPLESDELNLAWPLLRRFATPVGEFTTPILGFDGYPLDLGEQRELNSVDPIAGYRFSWGNRSCALLVTKAVDPVLAVTTGQVYTFDDEWAKEQTPRKGLRNWFKGQN